MKIGTFERNGRVRVGLIEDDSVRDAGENLFDLRPSTLVFALADVRLLAPVPCPSKIICVGLNYRDHAKETGQKVPSRPVLFAKFPSSVIGPGASIRMPTVSTSIDYEAELAVVIGRPARAIIRDQALDHVLGYTCLNDVSARDVQIQDGQWVRAKSFDTFCPLGPWIVTPDEIPDPQALRLRCQVNGRIRQDSSTSQMVFPVSELVSYVSQGTTLLPGDVIATGTPAGIGFAQDPPVYLKPGDMVCVEADGIGALKNPVVAEWS